MPEMIPVGNTGTLPNPNQGLNTLSSIIGLQQQRQTLQTGQYQQQSAAALAQQEQLKTAQQQGVQNFYSSFDPTQHVGDDGTVDLDSALQSKEFQAAGNAKPAIMQSLLDIKNKQLTNKTALAGLNSTLVNQFDTQMGAFAKDKDVIADATDPDTGINTGRAKINEAISNYTKQGPDAARIAQIYGPLLQNVKPGQLGAAVQSIQLQAQSASEQQAQQNPKQIAVPQGATTGILNVSPSQGVTPGQQPTTSLSYTPPPGVAPSPGGGLMRYGPGGAGLPQAGAGPPGQQQASAPPPSKLQPLQQPAPNAPAAQWNNYNSQVQSASQLLTGARAAANDPVTGVQATRFNNQQIMDLSPHALTGPGLKILNTIASRLPTKGTGDAYQDIAHYTALNSAALAQKMGVPNTNLGQETAAAAAGNVERNPAVLQEITRTNDALNTAFDLYNRGLQKVSNNGSDPSRVAAYQQAFGQNMDISAIRWADAHRRNDTDEISALTKKLGPQGITSVQQKLKTMQSLADQGDLP